MRGYRYYRRPLTRRAAARLILTLALLALIGMLAVAGMQMKQLLTKLAVTRVTNPVNRIVTQAVNETKHHIFLDVDVSVAILLPGFSTATQVSNAFTVAETVIVGTVPETYTYFSSAEPLEQDAKEYVLNR